MDAPQIERAERVVQPAAPGGIARTWLVVHGENDDGSPYVDGHRTYHEHGGEPPWSVRAQAKRDERAEQVAAYRHPPPLVPARAARGDETPRGALTLIKAAEAAGWWCRVTYAHGFTPPQWRDDPDDVGERVADIETGKLPDRRRIWCGASVESIAVVGEHSDGRRFLASWEASSSRLALAITPTDVQMVSVTDLKKWIKT